MPAPTPIPPIRPTGWNPRLIPNDVTRGGAGGGRSGLKPKAIKGVSIAFGSPHNAEAPLWQCLDDLGE